MFQKCDYKVTRSFASPAPVKKLLTPILKESTVGSLLGSSRPPTKDDEHLSSLLKRNTLDLSPLSKVSDPCDIPPPNHKDLSFNQIYDNKAPNSKIPSSDIEARCLFRPCFITESDEGQYLPPRFPVETVVCERMQPSTRTGKLRNPVGTPEDESRESWLPTDDSGVDWQTWRPPIRTRNTPGPIPDPVPGGSVDELRGVPMRATIAPTGARPPARETEASYPSPELHILAIDPNIILHRPRARRSATVSDPVHRTAPMHEETLNRQETANFVQQLVRMQQFSDIQQFSAQVMQNDGHVFQAIPKERSQHYDDLEPQNSHYIHQPADPESAYQAMLRKAHYKHDQYRQPKPLHEEGDHKDGEKDAPFSRIVIHNDAPNESPKIVMEPTTATIGRYLQTSSQNIIRVDGTIPNKVSIIPRKTELNKDSTTRKPGISQETSPRYTLIHGPLSPNKHNSSGYAEKSYTSNGRFVDQQVQLKQCDKAGSPRPNSTTKSTLSPTQNSNHSVPDVVPSPVNHNPSTSSPRRMQNKSVSWDPAITLIGPVINPANKRPTAETMLKRLFVEDGGKGVAETQETTSDKDVDPFISTTFKRWKKGDRNKLYSLLKVLRDIEADIDTASANGEAVDEDMQNNATEQNTSTGFDPRVPDFKPLVSKENEIWVQKARSRKPATLSVLAAGPIAPATINIPYRTALRGRPPWPVSSKFKNTGVQYQHSLGANSLANPGGDLQPVKKRLIWDNPEDPGGREAIMQSKRWAGELLEQFTKKYPLTGQKATVVPKKRLEDLPISRQNSNTLKVAKMVSNAADIQQKLELLLMQKKQAKARGVR